MSKLVIAEGKPRIETISTGEATIAIVRVDIDDIERTWTGTAKRFPGTKGEKGDKFDEAIGQRLALSRAFQSAASQLNRQAMGMVKCSDDNTRQSRAAAAKKKAIQAQGGGVFRIRSRRSPKTTSVAVEVISQDD